MRCSSRLALSGLSALALTAVGVTPASAGVDASVDLSLVASYCTSWYSWAGSNVSTKHASHQWPAGKVKHCAFKYRMKDSDPSADYYLAFLQSDFTHTSGYKSLPAAAYQRLSSSRSAVTNVFAGTPSYTSSKSCTTPVTISVGKGPFSASVTPQICSGYSVNRSYLGTSSVGWTAPKAAGANLMEGVYFQKVAQGAKPIFTYEFVRPTYTHTWNGTFWLEKSGWSTRTATL